MEQRQNHCLTRNGPGFDSQQRSDFEFLPGTGIMRIFGTVSDPKSLCSAFVAKENEVLIENCPSEGTLNIAAILVFLDKCKIMPVSSFSFALLQLTFIANILHHNKHSKAYMHP